jgi:hypothetical protein
MAIVVLVRVVVVPFTMTAVPKKPQLFPTNFAHFVYQTPNYIGATAYDDQKGQTYYGHLQYHARLLTEIAAAPRVASAPRPISVLLKRVPLATLLI